MLKSKTLNFTAVKKPAGSSFPPCSKMLYHKCLRANFLTCMWWSDNKESYP